MTTTIEAPAPTAAKPAKAPKAPKPIIVTTDALEKIRENVRATPYAPHGQQSEYRAALVETVRADSAPLEGAVEAALKAVNGGAERYAITHWYEVHQVVEEAEKRLERAGVPKSKRAGIAVTYTPAGPQAKAYKYAAASTRIVVRRRSADWILEAVTKTEVYPTASAQLVIEVDAEQEEVIRRHAMRGFSVRKPAPEQVAK